MKLATFSFSSGSRVGVVDVEHSLILDLARAAELLDLGHQPGLGSMLTLIEEGHPALDLVHELAEKWPEDASFNLTEIKLLSPLPVPAQIRDCLVFEEHLRNAHKAWAALTNRPTAPIPGIWYERPTWYKANRFSVIGTGEDVIWPCYSELMDFELELACVIGKRGTNIPIEAAADHIFGLTIFNDFSARDIQMIERPLGMGPMKGKDFDTGNVLGPWIVTTDELPIGTPLRMEARVNGEHWGGGNSSAMHHDFPKILNFISDSETLHPGEVIASGTVGTGCGLELGRFLSPGDRVTLEIEGIGILENKIIKIGVNGGRHKPSEESWYEPKP